MTLLALSGVGRRFAGPRVRQVLRDVTFSLSRGEHVAIVGESGVGKSTLLNIVAGLDRPDTGTVTFEGRDLSQLDDDALTLLRRSKVGFVFQAFHVLPYLSVAGNVALPLRLNGEDPTARTAEMLEAVGLADRADSLPRDLSGGELQRVAIARALVHRPRLLLADEPTGNLDPETAAGILVLLRDAIRSSGAAGILVTHSPEAARTTDRILRLTGDGLREEAPIAGETSVQVPGTARDGIRGKPC